MVTYIDSEYWSEYSDSENWNNLIFPVSISVGYDVLSF